MPPERPELQKGGRSEGGNDGRTDAETGGYVPRAAEDRGESVGEPDVLLDVPVLNVEELDLEVEDLRARISYAAELADMVKIDIGIEAEVGKAKINIRGIEVQAQLKARLDNVRAIFGEVLETLQRNPELARDMLRAPDQAKDPVGRTTREAGRAGETVAGAASRTGRGTTDEDEGGSGDGAAGGRTSGLGDLPIEEEYTDERGRLVGRARDEFGEDVEEILDEDGNSLAPDPSAEAREDDRPDATDAARRRAEELGLALAGVTGTGSGGRILVRDVEEAGRNGA